jgi:hypothetical protein
MGNAIVVPGNHALMPVPIVAAGENATRSFIEFFTDKIRNRNTQGSSRQNRYFFSAAHRTK